MPIQTVDLTQGSADNTTKEIIDTFLTSDGKSGWRLIGMKAYWVNAASPGADANVIVTVATADGISDPGSNDFIMGVNWIIAADGTPGNTFMIPWAQFDQPMGDRITVQPELHVRLGSAATGQANNVVVELEYETVKLSDIEVLRLLAGGA